MPKTEPPDCPSLETLEAILAAANSRLAVSPETTERLRVWLADATSAAMRRAQATILSRGDMERLESAYVRFRQVIAELQDRDDPPPQFPLSESGWTAWDHWLVGNKHFGFPQGRRESSDWRLIAALLALYETVSGNDASAAQCDGPTMRYLKTALAMLAGELPAHTRNHFSSPNVEAVRKQLPGLRETTFPFEKRALAEIISKSAG